VDGEAGDLVPEELDLTGVKPGAHLEPEGPHAVAHGAGAADSARGAVEGGQEAIARGVDLTAAEPAELAPDDGVVLFVLLPASVGARLIAPDLPPSQMAYVYKLTRR
jgi:hypothetical protein